MLRKWKIIELHILSFCNNYQIYLFFPLLLKSIIIYYKIRKSCCLIAINNIRIIKKKKQKKNECRTSFCNWRPAYAPVYMYRKAEKSGIRREMQITKKKKEPSFQCKTKYNFNSIYYQIMVRKATDFSWLQFFRI